MMDKTKGQEIIQRVEEVRTALHYNRSAFCRVIGMSPQTYNNFIGPQGSRPNVEMVMGVARGCGASTDWLLFGTGTMFGTQPGDESHPILQRMAQLTTQAQKNALSNLPEIFRRLSPLIDDASAYLDVLVQDPANIPAPARQAPDDDPLCSCTHPKDNHTLLGCRAATGDGEGHCTCQKFWSAHMRDPAKQLGAT